MKVENNEVLAAVPSASMALRAADFVSEPEGHRLRWAWLERVPAAVVLPVRADGRVGLITQPRPPVQDDACWEAPAGKIDPAESPLEAAKRELAEECRLCAADECWEELGGVYASPGTSSEILHLFIARAVRLHPGTQAEEDTERITLHWLELEEALAKTQDAKSRILLQAEQIRRLRG